MRSATAASVPLMLARTMARADVVGLVPDHKQCGDVVANPVDLLDHCSGCRAVEPLGVASGCVDAGVRQGLPGARSRGAQHGIDGRQVGAQPATGQPGLPDTPRR